MWDALTTLGHERAHVNLTHVPLLGHFEWCR